jgi:hypothetical protein
MSNEPDLTEKQVQAKMRGRLGDLEAFAGTLQVINDHGELCRDGQRAVNGLADLAEELIERIEQDTDVKGIADHIQTAYNTL